MVDSALEENRYFTMYNKDDDEFVEVELDFKSRAQVVMTPEHHAIHRRQMFKVSEIKDVANGASFAVAFTTADSVKEVHFRLKVSSEAEALVYLYENPDSVSGGSAVVPMNKHRLSPVAAETIVTSDVTYTVGAGVRLDRAHLGSGKQSSGSYEDLDEWPLAHNQTYLVVVDNLAAGANHVQISAQFYEYEPYFAPPA